MYIEVYIPLYYVLCIMYRYIEGRNFNEKTGGAEAPLFFYVTYLMVI